MRVPACTLTLLAGVLASWLSWLSVCVSEKGKAKVLFQEPCSQSWLHPSCAPHPPSCSPGLWGDRLSLPWGPGG